jgi:hypothetical protein
MRTLMRLVFLRAVAGQVSWEILRWERPDWTK